MILDEEVYLEHFGVKGMQWGKHNAKSVSADKQAHRNSKAEKYESRAVGAQARINKIDVRLAKYKRRTPTRDNLQDTRDKLARRKETALKDAEAKRKGKLSSGQKKAIGFGVVVGIAAGAYGANLILNRHKNLAIKDMNRAMESVRNEHSQYVAAKKLMDTKMQKRYNSLKDLAAQTPKGHPSHEGALKEIENLHTFYKTRLERMAKEYNVSAEALKKMNLGGFV